MNQTLEKFPLFLLELYIQIEFPNNYSIQQHNTLADIEGHCKKGHSRIHNFHYSRTQFLEYLDYKFLHFYQFQNIFYLRSRSINISNNPRKRNTKTNY